jgi:hypothetical protein
MKGRDYWHYSCKLRISEGAGGFSVCVKTHRDREFANLPRRKAARTCGIFPKNIPLHCVSTQKSQFPRRHFSPPEKPHIYRAFRLGPTKKQT